MSEKKITKSKLNSETLLPFYWQEDSIFWLQGTQGYGLWAVPWQHMDIMGTLTKPDSRCFPYILCQVSYVPEYSTIPTLEKIPPSSALPWWVKSVCRTPMDRKQAQVTPVSAGVFYFQGLDALKLYLMAAEQNLQSLALWAAFLLSQRASS